MLVKMWRMLLVLLLLLLLPLVVAGGVVLLDKRVEVWLLLMLVLVLVLHTRLNGNQAQRRLRSQRACFGGLSHDWEFN